MKRIDEFYGICPACGELKHINDFIKNKRGYYTRCKGCKGTHAYYMINRLKLLAYQKARYENIKLNGK